MARRHSNGEGTLYQRKDGRWEGAVYVLTTSGVRKRVRVYGATRAEAHKKLTGAKAKNDQGIPAADKSWKLSSYLDYWLAEVVKPNRRPATYAQCETIVRLYLKPGLGNQPINKLSVPVLQRFVNQLLAEGHSISKVHVVRKVLSAALTRAEREEITTRNPARLIELPTLNSREVEPWSITEATQFLAVARSHRLYAAFLLLMLYGLRRGEVLGLRWQDIDTAKNVLHIRQQLQRVGRELLQGPVKTQAGRRDLPLVGLAQAAIREYEGAQPKSPDHDLVFTTNIGTPIEPRNFVLSFQRLCKRNGIRIIKLHALRHTAATLLKDLGVPAREAQLILGHSHVSVTQQVYQHGSMDSRRKAVGALEAAFARLMPKTKTPQESPGESASGTDGNSSRQFSRQINKVVDQATSFLSGATIGIRTRDLFLTINTQGTAAERISEMDGKLQDCRRRRMLGIVAVDLAVRLQAQRSNPRCSDPHRADNEAA
ncbi:tyrosine-type recombinase/integrase [Streptomyces sp. 351MFTsu5.1]|uniref:tyrosine-type recombinase/integrase n=1 Tax=Streptomyces sp. 351MFTsu5.1 TaxID=1172180 RepID=UPI0009978C37|nr:site-specific integrase [Streptomyces sp. 351MFTsu5.1]